MINKYEDPNSLSSAFKKRFGRKDNESFLNVVTAFFYEVDNDSMVTIPMGLNTILNPPKYQPLLVALPDGRSGLCILSDEEYMDQYDDNTHMSAPMSQVIQMMIQNDFCGGIIINSFSESHCFLPKEAVIEMLKQRGDLR